MGKSTYHHLINPENVKKGIKKSYAHKSKRQRAKKEVVQVMDNLEEIVTRLVAEIESGTYQVGSYRHFILKDRKKERNISVLPFIDRGVQNLLKDAIEPILLGKVTDDMCGGLPGRGIWAHKKKWSVVHKMRKILKKPAARWCILLDIHHCYDSIKNVTVMRLLEKYITDKRTLWLIREHLFNRNALAIGDPISHLYCNLVVSTIIRGLKEEHEAKNLVNFADNIAIFGETKEEVLRLAKAAKQLGARQRLKFNRSYPFEVTSSVSFCGRTYTKDKVLLRSDTKKRYAKAKRKPASMASYHGLLMSVNGKNLQKRVEGNV